MGIPLLTPTHGAIRLSGRGLQTKSVRFS